MSYNEEPSEETLDRWHRDPDNWVWGLFYYNKEDSRIFAPKKIREMGFTINFANPNSVLSIVLILAFMVFIAFVLEQRW